MALGTTFYLTIAAVAFLIVVHLVYAFLHKTDKEESWFQKYKPLLIIDLFIIIFLLFVYLLKLLPDLLK